ncbi:MAG TPA: DnaB-like helicase N-terminal domain-containing protein, partial [Ornithinimicrobium sp.]|nr:DnaB-like helicase N-terminal domain-containing protein [Ornithinimicrobium sp.]
MSVTDHDAPSLTEPSFEEWGDGPSAYAPGEQTSRPGDRVPPQDNAAEQSVLGAMLLSKDAIADVSETVRGSDFYRPAHEVI